MVFLTPYWHLCTLPCISIDIGAITCLFLQNYKTNNYTKIWKTPLSQNGSTDTSVFPLLYPLILENETYRRLGVGSLLGDVLDRFTYASTKSTAQKMALYGTHDTTIAAILATLGVFDKRWPNFTSNITFELFKTQSGGLFSFSRSKYFVRMRYNQTVVMLPGMHSVSWGLI